MVRVPAGFDDLGNEARTVRHKFDLGLRTSGQKFVGKCLRDCFWRPAAGVQADGIYAGVRPLESRRFWRVRKGLRPKAGCYLPP